MDTNEGIYVTCAIIQDSKGKILICQRPLQKDQGGEWEFPGGKLEAGETAEECIKREIKEELGVRITIIKNLKECPHAYPNKLIILMPFICRFEIGEIPKLNEHNKMEWVELQDVFTYSLAEADKKVLQRYIEAETH